MTAKQIWDRLYTHIQNPYGVAGVMGNFEAESALRPNNLQDSYQGSLGHTDESYTAAVDNGSYGNFVYDCAGYGFYQATFWSIKQHLLNYARAHGKSVGDGEMQVDAFIDLIKKEYAGVWSTLKSAASVRQASDAVLLKFERPADQSEGVQAYRARLGQKWYDQYANSIPSASSTTPATEAKPKEEKAEVLVEVKLPIVKSGSTGQAAKAVQTLLIGKGYYCGGSRASGHEEADGIFGEKSDEAVKSFQGKMGLEADGVVGAETWTALLTT